MAGRLCKKPQRQRSWGWHFCELQSKVFSVRSWRCHGEVRREGFWGSFTSSGGWQLPSGKWDGAEPHGHGDIQQNSPGLLEEGLVPPTTGSPIVQSWLRADPAWLQEGIIRGSSAWDSTTELLPREGRRFIFPFLAAGQIPADPNPNGQSLSYLDVQTLTLGSFHKHVCRIWEHIAPELDGIDQYSNQQLLSCGKGKCRAQWQTETEFHCCPGPSASLNPDPAPLEVTTNFPICINEIWTRGPAESWNTICTEILKKSDLMNRISYKREKCSCIIYQKLKS